MTIKADGPLQSPFRFFDLPPEIRNIIYGLVIPDCVTIGQECLAIVFNACVFSVDLTVSGNFVKFLEWIYNVHSEDIPRIRWLVFQSTLKGLRSRGCSNDRRACFIIHGGPRSPTYLFGCGFIEPFCRELACGYSNHTDDCLDHAINYLGPLIRGTPLGNLTTSDVVGWVHAILRCASCDF